MVGSEVDQKYLGTYAKSTTSLSRPLSAGLYKLLGLSTLLSRKLLRARKQRKLDPTRSTKSLDLYRHIIWMAREGLTILNNEIKPVMINYPPHKYGVLNELRVLVAKMTASFLHIFVLFDNTYQAKAAQIPNFSSKLSAPNGSLGGAKGAGVVNTSYAYITPTIDAFVKAEESARRLLPGSHPLRLSVKLEYSAFLYDCTRDYEKARDVAKGAVDEAFASMDAMDDDAFEDAMELVGNLGVLAKRGEPSPRPSPRLDNHNEEKPNGHTHKKSGRHATDKARNT